jgi:hypothetical protein
LLRYCFLEGFNFFLDHEALIYHLQLMFNNFPICLLPLFQTVEFLITWLSFQQ